MKTLMAGLMFAGCIDHDSIAKDLERKIKDDLIKTYSHRGVKVIEVRVHHEKGNKYAGVSTIEWKGKEVICQIDITLRGDDAREERLRNPAANPHDVHVQQGHFPQVKITPMTNNPELEKVFRE